MQISSNGTRVLYALGLGEAAERLGVVVAGKEIRLWSTGQTWKLFDLGAVSVERYGFPYMMFHRGDLHAVLLDAIRRERPDAIHLDRKCTGVTQNEDSVTHRIRARRSRHARRSSIGADGVQSRVRFAVFGADRPEFTGIVAWRGLMPRERVPAGIKLDVGTNWVGPGRPRRALSGARRRAAQFRRPPGARRLAGGKLDRAGHQGRIRQRLPRLASRHPRLHPQRRRAVQMGAVRAAADAGLDQAAASRCSATPATPCCRCWRRAR